MMKHKPTKKTAKTKPIIGQHVWIIENDLKIVEKRILAIIHDEKEDKYKLDVQSCGGLPVKDIFLTEAKAEVVKKNFLDSLKFKVGDLLIFEETSWSTKVLTIGRITKIKNTDTPYTIKTCSNTLFDLTDKNVVLKIKNEYIENFGNIKQLNKEFNEARDELESIMEEMNAEHNLLECELKKSFSREYAWYRISKKPLFKDRFNYQNTCDE